MNALTLNEHDRHDVLGQNDDIDFDHRRYHPLRYHFRDLDWAIFGTVTWAWLSRRNPYSHKAAQFRREDFRGAMFRTCAELRLRYSDLAYYRATEVGAGECHMHFLVANHALRNVTPTEFARMFEHLWTRGFRVFDRKIGGVGTAEIRPYSKAFGESGAAYCLKREYDQYRRELERDDFLSVGLKKLITKHQQAVCLGLD